MTDVYDEVNALMVKHRVRTYKSDSVSRKYAFELFDVPRESDYFQVLYPYTGKWLLTCDPGHDS